MLTFIVVNKTSTFIETTGTPFSRRSALTAVVWQNKLIVFGGWNGFSKTWFNDLYEFNFGTNIFVFRCTSLTLNNRYKGLETDRC